MASINLSENLLVICSSQHINLFKRQNSLLDYSFLSSIDITTIEVNLKGNRKKKTDQDKILCSSLSNNSKYFAVGTTSKLLLIFNLNENKELSQPFYCELIKAPTKICFLNNETVLVSNRFGSLFKFEISESKISEGAELLGHFSMLLDFCISPNGKFVLTADRDEKIRISRFPQTYVIEGFYFGHTSFVKSIAFIDDNKLISGGGDSIIYLWDINLFKCISTSCKVSETAIRKVGVVEIFEEEISKEGIICLPDQSNSILLFSLNDQQQMTKMCSFNCSNENEYIFDFVVDVDRKTVFCVGRQGVYYFQPTTINLPSTGLTELKFLQFSPPLNNYLLNELNLSEDQLPLNSLYKIPLNGKNLEDYKNRKEEKLGEKKKKMLKEEEEN
uniref:tRNA (guanine-N(7)-)-methyltransferase non-catalytic subunit n=1 Tax=Meloidogyne enterolobii TaxID=390850 RepID=A0A6V7UFI5_MELEN|nr:unnamed protein product [Meloidogyne enterolobii]